MARHYVVAFEVAAMSDGEPDRIEAAIAALGLDVRGEWRFGGRDAVVLPEVFDSMRDSARRGASPERT